MANQIDVMSPFAGLATKSSVAAERDAETDKIYGKRDFWVYQAARAGNAARDAMAAKGYNLSQEDEKAIVNEKLMKEAGFRAQAAVKEGRLTQGEAQKEMLKNVMSGLIAAGDVEGAMTIAPQLKAIEAQEAEISKLYAQGYEASNKGAKAQTETARIMALTPAEIQFKREQARAAGSLANLRDRTPRLGSSGTSGSAGGLSKKAATDWANTLQSTMGVNRKITQLFELVHRNPAIATDAGQTIAALQEGAKTIGAQARSGALESELEEDDSKVSRALGTKMGKGVFEKQKISFNGDAAEFRSTVMDLAYVLAKARDPGGRLSDADVENAIKIIGVSGDPQAMGQVLGRVASNQIQAVRDQIKSFKAYGGEDFQEGIAEAEKTYSEFLATVDRYSAAYRPPTPGGSSPNGRGKGSGWQMNESTGLEETNIDGQPVRFLGSN